MSRHKRRFRPVRHLQPKAHCRLIGRYLCVVEPRPIREAEEIVARLGLLILARGIESPTAIKRLRLRLRCAPQLANTNAPQIAATVALLNAVVFCTIRSIPTADIISWLFICHRNCPAHEAHCCGNEPIMASGESSLGKEQEAFRQKLAGERQF